jgi:hypothetical protein
VLFLRMQDDAQISPPSGDGVDQIPEGGETKIDQMPTYARPLPLGLNIDRCINNDKFVKYLFN